MFVLSDANIKSIRNNHPALKGKKLIGTGQYSGVFEGSNPNTVLKLSIDRASYVFHTSYMLDHQSSHITKVIKDYGIVGNFVTSKNVTRTAYSQPDELTVPVFLYEVEKLDKIQMKTPNKLLSHRLTADWRKLNRREEDECEYECSKKAIAELKAKEYMKGQESCIEALELITYFNFIYSDSFSDIHGANLMQRPNGEFVFSDPIGDLHLYCCHRAFRYDAEINTENAQRAQDNLKLAYAQ